MARISITQVGTRVSINLDCADDDEARQTYHAATSQKLDCGYIFIGDRGRFYKDFETSDYDDQVKE